ncbi:hypothetical protein EOS_33895 [Caballeronia mineralivorans PML1(12)]|uniref:Uncharacterized protein n=1 Tax=Caballeronia mineralivorans PML1(12) TaxID=908627 RepID=A0A0J1CN55_9BURK|nr:hypothetical protein [Caballeronia mineralivorans]KLU21831.1 hypothetical protein EOS_33895 [Caballeronia mineralivorans PML1(12)]
MAPTPVGERLIEGVARVLAMVQQEIWSAKSFDATTTASTFSVCLSDMRMDVFSIDLQDNVSPCLND